MGDKTFFADWIVPITRPPVQRGFISIKDGIIKDLGAQSDFTGDPSKVTTLDHAVVFPALINTLFHPDFSTGQRGQIPKGNFITWLHAAQNRSAGQSASDYQSQALSALRNILEAGTAAVGIRTHHPEIGSHLENSGIYSAIFHTIAGFKGYHAGEIWRQSKRKFQNWENTQHTHHHLSGEFLFTTAPLLLLEIAKMEKRIALPIAVCHDEEYFLTRRNGAIYQYLLSRDDMDYRWRPPQVSPIQYLLDGGFAVADNILSHLIHISEEDLDALSEYPVDFHICLHPRFDRVWELGTAPAALMCKKGFNLCLGTFAEHLDLRKEMRSALAEYGFRPDEILEMATINGAVALGFENQLGSIDPGKQARLFMVTDKSGIGDPYDLIFSNAKLQPLS
ncbi:MAG: amidohydrolase family protein [Lentisphaeria bacterium]|nr:amidohydrolase family protein [Candidatus Neomarinimicrobiota bacterium]MCF7841793.1 amidohydrolase family protein [Lentisphaeria bacterium]